MERHILVVLPHPDDEAFGLSGTLSKHIQNGTKVTYACLTLGEMGRNMGTAPFANRVTLPQIRKKELEASCRVIGIQDLRTLGFHDKTLEFEDQYKLEGSILEIIKEINPSLVITFYPGYAVHPDHDATGAAVISTIRKMPAEQRPKVHCLAFSKNCEQFIGKPDLLNNVKDFLHIKKQSIESHRTQFYAPEILGGNAWEDPEVQERFGTERFWTYNFNQ